MDSTSASHFTFIAGVLGFVMAVAWCRAYFPSIQMKFLDDLLKETQQIYEQAETENLFPSEKFRKISKSMLASMEQRSLPLRKGTYNATTVIHEFLALFNGLSLRIIQLSYRVKKLRACLHATSEIERSKRRHGSRAPLDNGGADDTSVLLLMSIDPSFDPESVHCPSNQEFGGSSDPRQGQIASCPTAELESAVRDVLVGPGDSHHQDNYSPRVGAPLSASEEIPLFTPVAASVQWVYLRKSAGSTPQL
ncbi:uncharacterized protein LACBIDRAFT_308683 [Laccaria bicolor S238N-H82]|uniref:Predicted protein n=1 Tax=Laccaria bicolor (strain S238N-H82 / ATCC MYA-4686) TaxID=486041 RepID=B0CWY2_LACBS|nr:uncharacterized protein LACBIDRAFT_308683 [Laccaria bicolor S238N-H82]EDR13148.1 predicted protein [Laccaria bicolor S238N-H82]|eukprot:XP_001875646.1 predicted protein [Laccaria bicolor S238N-H82]